MKASLEVIVTNENQGVVLEAESPEEGLILKRLWSHHGRPVSLEGNIPGSVKLTIAPRSEEDDV